MLVACSLVNLTTWAAAEPALVALRARCPGPADLASADPASLEPLLRPLGLWRRRAASLVRMARAWEAGRPRTREDVLRLPGCGPYAADSWAIFVEGRSDVRPTDDKLLWHLGKGDGA